MNKVEAKKWRNLALAITILGIIIFSLPWIPGKVKFLSAIPLYIIFVYVYYKYICLKRSMVPDNCRSIKQEAPGGQGSRRIDKKKGKMANKKDRC